MVDHLSIILTSLCVCVCLQYFIHTLGKKNISVAADSPCRICDALMKSCTHPKCVGGNNSQRSDQSQLLCLSRRSVCLGCSQIQFQSKIIQSSSCFSPRGHGVHCPAEAAPHLPPLVPPHHRSALLLVLLQGPGGRRRLVHDHELHSSRLHVLLLYGEGGRHSCAPPLRHDDHRCPDHADGRGSDHPGSGLPLDGWGALSDIHGKHNVGFSDVPELLDPFCLVLLWHLPQSISQSERIQIRVDMCLQKNW